MLIAFLLAPPAINASPMIASGYLFDQWSTRLYGEFFGTTCQFYESSEIFNCAYNHVIY